VSGIGAVVVPGTVRDSLHILDGLLDLDAGPRPEILATDTGSYSDQMFGLFSLLGYRFSLRLADLPDQRFWRIDPHADYGPLDPVAGRNRVNLVLITANWLGTEYVRQPSQFRPRSRCVSNGPRRRGPQATVSG